jgi:hypothetical protein
MWLQRIAAWCDEFNLVYDDPTIANEHQENEKHSRIEKTYRISSNRALLLLLISNFSLFYPRFHSIYIFKQNYPRDSLV